jgi:NhaP-type Na+/H+ or K+/H+ antiporter
VFATGLIIGQVIQRKKPRYLSEASANLLLGIIVGIIGWACRPSEVFAYQVSFKSEIFLLAIIPATMFHNGYSLEVKPFFLNIWSICLTGCLGTAISTFVIGYMM